MLADARDRNLTDLEAAKWLRREGTICSLQSVPGEQRAMTRMVRREKALVARHRCGDARCRHYSPAE